MEQKTQIGKKKMGIVFLALLVVMLIGTPVFGSELIIKGGADLNGSFSTKALGITTSTDVEMGFSVGADYYFLPLSERIEIGVGVEYQLTRKLKEYVDKIQYIPIYITGRMSLPIENFQTYLVGRFGYDLFNYDGSDPSYTSKGGLYYGAGGGLSIGNILLEVVYSQHKGIVEIEGYPIDIDCNYSKIALMAGIIL